MYTYISVCVRFWIRSTNDVRRVVLTDWLRERLCNAVVQIPVAHTHSHTAERKAATRSLGNGSVTGYRNIRRQPSGDERENLSLPGGCIVFCFFYGGSEVATTFNQEGEETFNCSIRSPSSQLSRHNSD